MLASTITLLEALVLIGTVLWITQYSISRRAHAYERPSSVNQQINQLPKVSIIIPAYREKRQSIEKTLDSLSSQNYPRNLMEVLVVVDRDDVHTLNETLKAVETFLNSLNIKVIINENAGRRLKAIAINNAMKHVSGSIVGIYDADDVFPRDQVLNAVLLMMEKNYAAVGTRVYRFRNTVLGSLMYLESLVWYNAIVPFLRTTVKITPLSGEGLFIRRDVVTSIPESLAEDALLSLELSRRGYGIGLLDSYVYELAPLNIASFIRQRIRWNKGYAQNFLLILRQGVRAGYVLRILVMYVLIALPPALLIVSAVGFATVVYMTIIVKAFTMDVIYQLILAILLSELVVLYLIRDYVHESMSMGRAFVLLPIYWFLLGTVTITSPFIPINNWLKTTR
ncbi:MAG: glycosyltransferase [Vulcanisaeta sp.]|jgi:cellulose synthase/poly-beta-1,6-N-acetylglucosamine synthase-like glycosyltransferase|nr:MAG: glycosyl transferase family 2 [Vulcanisaeta sp. MG_3]MCG2864233.1 glycosyltransferase [Vulcanisaeta sp.]MCG2865968.1 glycosyltransferase [Vulcanisaeta sp.]MCG2885267.1 glycosyltransferase [Vulcanisaeta sp.]